MQRRVCPNEEEYELLSLITLEVQVVFGMEVNEAEDRTSDVRFRTSTGPAQSHQAKTGLTQILPALLAGAFSIVAV